MKQSEVLELCERWGFYSAALYKEGNSIKGIRNVAPAERLAEKGKLVLREKRVEKTENGEIIHYKWVKW